MGVGKNCGPCNLIFTIKSRARGLKWGTKGPHMCDSGSLGKDAVDLCGGVGINMNSGKQRGNHHYLRDCSVGVGSENPMSLRWVRGQPDRFDSQYKWFES